MSDIAKRLEDLRARLEARTAGSPDKPLPGYAANVEAIKAEIARLEALDNDKSE